MLLGVSYQRPFLSIVVASVFSVCLLLIWFRNIIPQKIPRAVYNRKSSAQPLLDDIFNSTLGFEKIFVVNLPARTDHRDAMVLTAALSNMTIEFVPGVKGDEVLEKVLPPGALEDHVNAGSVGAWRAHMNAISAVVEQGLSSALIFEDDVDWDVRIKSQLRDFALGSQALLQPLAADPSSYADPTYPTPNGLPAQPPDMYYGALPATMPPTTSPYGDGWDVLWIGHCGVRFPNTDLPGHFEASEKVPKGRAVHLNDESVPADHHYLVLSQDDDPREIYPEHTRVVHHAMGPLCTLGYAVSQKGARRLLHELGLKKLNGPFDVALSQSCEGSVGHGYHNCLTAQPQYFHHHRPAGRSDAISDITSHGDEVIEKASTENIRWSARLNVERLLAGETTFDDQYPDDA
ncbi:MAG: hypothetical protein M1817_000809 [Caeruleum heppii]|nr:MAG: hypothetical protein M1817_000809 [Caeruleum heppii]